MRSSKGLDFAALHFGRYWPIAAIRCDAMNVRFRGNADIDPNANQPRFMNTRPNAAGRYLGAGAGAAAGAPACGLRAGAGLLAGAATAGFGFTDGSSMVMAESGKRVQYWFLPNSEMPI